MSPETVSNPSRPPIRWWPAAVIVAIELALLAYFWLREAPHIQARVIPTFPTLFFCNLALFGWLVLFSRLSGRTRLTIFVVAAALVGAGFALLEIQGVDGNLVPILGWRWSSGLDLEAVAGVGAVVEAGSAERKPGEAASSAEAKGDGGKAGSGKSAGKGAADKSEPQKTTAAE